MFKTIIKMLTPFIISVMDIICGVILYLKLEYGITINYEVKETLSHLTGSSVLLIAYIIVHSTHMCKYYKSMCYLLLLFHVFTIIYIYTNITTLEYIYLTWSIMSISLVLWTISVLGHKTYKTIHQACKH